MINSFIIDIAQDKSWSKSTKEYHPVYAFSFKKETFNKLQNTEINEDIKKAGVYILLGYNKSKNAVSNIYVGEANNIYDRLNGHKHFNSDWCQEIIVFTSTLDYNKNQLNHAEEIILTNLKRFKKQVNFHNKKQKSKLKISLRAKQRLENDINIFWYLLKKIDFDYFDDITNIKNLDNNNNKHKTKTYNYNKIKKELKTGLPEEIRVFISDKHNNRLLETGDAQAIFYPNTKKIIIKSGKFNNFLHSRMREEKYKDRSRKIKKLRHELQTIKKGDFFYINEDSKPLSPSAACEIFLGDVCNGWNWWKVRDLNTGKISSLNYYTGRVPQELFLKDQHFKKPISYSDKDKNLCKNET